MRSVFVLGLAAAYLLSACQPSARFSSENRVGDDRPVFMENGITDADLERFVQDWLNVPYHYGGMSKSGVDCSGFSTITMRRVYGLQIPRTASQQYTQGKTVRMHALLPGDLVFFKNVRGRGVDHVGIYLGNNRFAHATESTGVTISELYDSYYQERLAGACRYRE